MTAAAPTAPVPKTARVEPILGFSSFRTVPAPVLNPHPSGPKCVSGTSDGTLTTDSSTTFAYVAKDD
jgi:hypothetical protein